MPEVAVKLHSNKVCRNNLQKYVNKRFYNQDAIRWYIDTETETTYTLNLEYASTRYQLICDRTTLEITVKERK